MIDLRSIVIGSVLMLKKYMCVNITIYEEANEQDYKNGIMVLPLIGLAIGFVAFFISSLRYIYDGFFISSAMLLYYCIITKTENIKDAYRAFNYYWKPSNQTEHVTGIVGVVIILLTYFSLFRIVPLTALIIMPMTGFSNLIILSKVIKRDMENTSILKYCNNNHVITAFVISFFFAAIINYKLVISLSLTFMIMGFAVSILDRKIINVPSSIEGAIIEISQLIFLVITYLFSF